MTKPVLTMLGAILFALVGQAAVAGDAVDAPASPEALGFTHFLKCPSDRDVTVLGDTKSPAACLAVCRKQPHVAGCWWLDGTGGFRRECRVCRTLSPVKEHWPNDWGIPLNNNELIVTLFRSP
jgi:hypothetical protein